MVCCHHVNLRWCWCRQRQTKANTHTLLYQSISPYSSKKLNNWLLSYTFSLVAFFHILSFCFRSHSLSLPSFTFSLFAFAHILSYHILSYSSLSLFFLSRIWTFARRKMAFAGYHTNIDTDPPPITITSLHLLHSDLVTEKWMQAMIWEKDRALRPHIFY